MMQQALKRGRGDHPLAEHLAPGAEAPLAGEEHRPALVAATDDLEEQIGAGAVDRQVADLVDDQQLRRCVNLERLVQPALAWGLAERGIRWAAVVNNTR